MPDWMADLTLTEITGTIVGVLFVAGVFWKVRKPIKRVTDTWGAFMATWNGTPEIRDDSGAFVKAAVPGIPAQLETIRGQVQNSHKTNLRVDIDALAKSVTDLVAKVDQHIDLAKESDDRQNETERIVTKYLPALRKLLED